MQGTPPDGAEAPRIDLDEIERLARASLAAKTVHEGAVDRTSRASCTGASMPRLVHLGSVECEAAANRTAARTAYLAALPEEIVIEMVRRLR